MFNQLCERAEIAGWIFHRPKTASGFDFAEAAKPGVGNLVSIRERFVGTGTTVSMSVPLVTWIERA